MPAHLQPASQGFAAAQRSQRHTQPFDYDIAIAGGGIVGATLAAALRYSGLSVALIEAQPQSDAVAKGQAYAIHLGTRQIYEAIGIWDELEPQIEYFERVKLSDGHAPQVVTFEPQDLNTQKLGYVATHRVLLQALQTHLNTCEHVQWFCPASVDHVDYGTTGATVHLSAAGASQQLRVRLVVGADGARSRIRTQAGIQTWGWPYWQSCLVATIQPEHHHRHTAYEKFWPTGPFAILPAAPDQCRIVWTAPHTEAQRLLALSDQEFLVELEARYGQEMGRLSILGQRYLFPAKWMQARTYIKSRLALVGDAAHCCHPVGGQGLNLGIRDVAALAEVLQVAHEHHEDIGSRMVLHRYQDWRRRQNLLSLGFTDILNRTFSNQWVPLLQARRWGLWLMQRVVPLRVTALRFMAGLSGRSATLSTGWKG